VCGNPTVSIAVAGRQLAHSHITGFYSRDRHLSRLMKQRDVSLEISSAEDSAESQEGGPSPLVGVSGTTGRSEPKWTARWWLVIAVNDYQA
jgi:hypothetical protein